MITKFLARMMLKQSDAGLIKASGGAPRAKAGRTLDARFQFLEAQARKRPTPADFGPPQGRAATDELIYMFAGNPEPGVRWESLTIPAEGRSISARLYRPAVQDPKQAMIVFYHFGGGVVGNIETCHCFCSMLASIARTAVLNVEYRLAPEHRWPAGLEDAVAAYEWGAANAVKFGAAPGKAAVGGDSMGGNFSAIVCQEMKRKGGPQPVLQILIYPATDLTDQGGSMVDFADAFPLTSDTMAWFMSQYLPEGANMADPRLSPMKGDLTGLAPALIYTAGFDPLTDQGKRYAEALNAAGVTAKFRCYDSLAHAFTAFTGAIPAADAACREIAREVSERLA
jgi:acetyl esterase/lipase